MSYISKNFKYPEAANEAGLEGRLFVSFVIDQNGKTTGVQVVQSQFPQTADPALVEQVEAYALELMSDLPRLRPAEIEGKEVAVSFTVPIVLRLS